VVLATHNRAHEATRTVQHLLELPERPSVVVVDNGSSDGTSATVKAAFPAITCLTLKTNLGGGGRNIGASVIDRPYVAFCDDDSRWEPGALQRAADFLDAYPRLAVIGGKMLVGGDGRLDPICELMAGSPLRGRTRLPGPAVVGFLAGGSVVRRAAFLSAGGFEQRLLIGGEEHLLALELMRAGWELAYVDAVVAHHYPSPQRDPAARERLWKRNHLWIIWLRRPLGTVLSQTLRALWRSRTDRVARSAFVEAVQGLPWVVRKRRVIPHWMERQLRRVELAERCLDGHGA
jgi:N-acetylglucosaminyl-diphospho-decaprenol L-rhamnosyltransferase